MLKAVGKLTKITIFGKNSLRYFSQCYNPSTPSDNFVNRHIGPSDADIKVMLESIGMKSLEELTKKTVPNEILLKDLKMPPPTTEKKALSQLSEISNENKSYKSMIGAGYYDTILPSVICRNMLENPTWYTSYTPYQAEISQGRLESLLNFQTMIADLTGFELSNASLLDESTAVGEAFNLAYRHCKGKRNKIFISKDSHPQNIGLLRTRADLWNCEVVVGDPFTSNFDDSFCGMIVQYPNTYGEIYDFNELSQKVHKHGALFIASADLLALTLLKTPKEMGFDICAGTNQRFGIPLGFGGPSAGFLALDTQYARQLPGRIIGVTIDSQNNPALRMAMQTREQHIKRDKATSNICTAQALLANISAAYAVYHGPEGLKNMAKRIHYFTSILANIAKANGLKVINKNFFDTITIECGSAGVAESIINEAQNLGYLIRKVNDTTVGISVGESIDKHELLTFAKCLNINKKIILDFAGKVESIFDPCETNIESNLLRTSKYLTHPIFNSYHSETQMMRYLYHLERKDLALNYSMISLGSCTMKLNSASSMIPITWEKFTNIHPYAPKSTTKGYDRLIFDVKEYLKNIAGFDDISLQPNSGANGEFAGLFTIANYLKATNQKEREICLIPRSAHGTNPASAVQAGFHPIVVNNTADGKIDMDHFKQEVKKYNNKIGCAMITYPSTYGIFDEGIRDICNILHSTGAQVYMDGANMNAQVGLTSPGTIGADVCHMNLHKTFAIPHGGGGPGVGAIGVKSHLIPYLPGHPVIEVNKGSSMTNVSASPYGSASILPIVWMYLRTLGKEGLIKSTQCAILNANYMAKRIEKYYNVLFRGTNGCVAHEFIIDIKPFKEKGVTETDVAKRLMDYGFHAPTMSFPVAGTLMIEPTESESKQELDRFCDALIQIRQEIDDVIEGRISPTDNPLVNAPHTLHMVSTSDWKHPYTREQAAFPTKWTKYNKYWPTVGRVNDVFGDRNLKCKRDFLLEDIPL